MPESTRPDDDEPTSVPSGAIRAEFDWSEVLPSTALVDTVAIAGDIEPTALEPLYDSIDPDALDTIISTRETDVPSGNTTVTFVFDGQEVTVQSDGTVVVRPGDAHSMPE